MKFLLLNLSVLFSLQLIAQKSIEAHPIKEKITLDGEMKEAQWNDANIAADFTQFKPNPGNQSSQKTEVRVLYDDQAIYIGAICFDDPEHVSKVLSQRDDFNANVDNFQVYFDTYNDDLNAFAFGVSSMGVQYDSKQFAETETPELNMVWNSAVVQNENGWQLEMRIPYSAIRFPKKDVQDWGINFFRYISRNREEAVWSPVKPDFDNWPAQFGTLTNLKGIEPPLRLAMIPYVSGYADHGADQNQPKAWSGSFNGGMDIKLGLNEAFTLDMTLVPDFRQVVFDNNVLNISPFEIQFNENRQFFTEGTELFNKSGLFYSRRIGIQSPTEVLKTNLMQGESLGAVPASSQLYNATKISGRTKTGLGIGLFNGLTAEQSGTAINDSTGAERSIVVSPLSNYNVLVLDQNLKNNSFITFTNTNVMREGVFYDANVSGLNTKINLSDNKYFIAGKGTVSAKLYTSDQLLGHNFGLSGGKQTGTFVIQGSYLEESDTYNPNDLGFNTNNNKRILESTLGLRFYKPFWKILQSRASATVTYTRLYNPDVYTFTTSDINLFALIKGFHATGLTINSSFTKGYDYFETRTPGRYFLSPTWCDLRYWFSSNYQKRFALDAGASYSFISWESWKEYSYSISPRFRINDKLFLIYSWQHEFSINGIGYAFPFGTPTVLPSGILFGSRDRINITNTVNLNYTLTNLMGISLRVRHYRSALSYNSFYDLNMDGTLSPSAHTGLDADGNSVYNINYNAFTLDFVYRWVYRPGSEINFVWKNAIFQNDLKFDTSYFSNLNNLFENIPLNSLSIKVIYWLDYQNLRKKTKV